MRNTLVFRLLKKVYRWAREKLYFGLILLPYGRKKHRKLLKTTDRLNNHTYTCFYRSPLQLEALTGPVLDHIAPTDSKTLNIQIFASSNGAEAYTVASALAKANPKLKFNIQASDLHQEMVEKAESSIYTLREITQGHSIPQEFILQTFDKQQGTDTYCVKEHLKSHVSFSTANLLTDDIQQSVCSADIIFIQNVLFHMPPTMATKVLGKIIPFMKNNSVLFIDGMELDMRTNILKNTQLSPLTYKLKSIYNYSRKHIDERWWGYYWGCEPYFALSKNRNYRYGTIFVKHKKNAS
ncbi:CheR family methyltransferase [Teredinibacter haidensis]|uniref:CheR family methyltransferase n=1 Tax=Teredinibacter haidensis TaxID=2731755 RepID=UPI0009488E89|nr:CheR family methyltransferase [Teredinibacter haidensis]